MKINLETKYYYDLLQNTSLPIYWKQTQLINLYIAEHQFDNIRSGLFASYTPFKFKLNRVLFKLLRVSVNFKLNYIANIVFKLILVQIKNNLIKEVNCLGDYPTLLLMILGPGATISEEIKSLFTLEDYCVGKPFDIFKFNSKIYSYELFEKFFRAKYILKNINKDNTKSNIFIEVGGGLGIQIEVLCRLNAKDKFILIETPSQAYGAYKYLKNIFREKKIYGAHEISKTGLPENFDILILDSSQNIEMQNLSKLGNITAGLNQRSFQEMEISFTKDYLDLFSFLKIDNIFLWEMREGHPEIKIQNRTDRKIYIELLKENYSLKDEKLEYFQDGFQYDVYNFERSK